MNTLRILPILPLIVGALLWIPESNPVVNPEIRTAPHPHHPKITELGCVKGKVSVSWFTYPFNPEQVKNNRKPNFLFNRGFTLKTDVALECGDVKVAAGRYALAFQLDAKAENWSALLIPQKMAQLQRQLGRARRRGGDVEGLEKQLADLTKKGIEELSLPSTTFQGKHAEHMALSCINHGYQVKGRRDPEPASGVEGEFRVSFGDLHMAFACKEVFAAKKDGDEPKPRRR